MKPELKRIEAMLGQIGMPDDVLAMLAHERLVDNAPPDLVKDRGMKNQSKLRALHTIAKQTGKQKAGKQKGERRVPPLQKAEKPEKSNIQPFPLPSGAVNPPAPEVANATATVAPVVTESVPNPPHEVPEMVQPFPVQPYAAALPLPRTKPLSLSSHRHAANPNLAMGLLKEVEGIVKQWQQELNQVVQQIQVLYQEGPIVDGWLESHLSGSAHVIPSEISTLRHAEIDHLLEFVEQLCRSEPTAALAGTPCTAYRLCGLDADGKLWTRPCPAEQVPYVGLAIARYQKLRTLLAKKQTLDNRLTSLVETLTRLHSQLQQ